MGTPKNLCLLQRLQHSKASGSLHGSSWTSGCTNVIINVRWWHTVGLHICYSPSTSQVDLHMSLPIRRKEGELQAIFSNQHSKVNNWNFTSPCLLNSHTFPHQLFITVLGHPNYSKIDILNFKKTSKASVNEMFNVCYSLYVSFTSNLWA